jgi:hypothetical protein
VPRTARRGPADGVRYPVLEALLWRTFGLSYPSHACAQCWRAHLDNGFALAPAGRGPHLERTAEVPARAVSLGT